MKDISQNTESKPKGLPPRDSPDAKQEEKVSLEVRKLREEIKSLQKKNRWETIAQLMPIMATILGVAGLFLTVFQFESQRASEQRKDRVTREVDQRAKFQNQIRTDIDEVLKFTRDEKQTVSRVAFLLEDIKTVMGSYVNESQKVADIFPGYERRLTESLLLLVRDDCDFTKNPRDVGLANVVLGRWDDYSNYLREEPGKLHYILYAYTRALQSLRDQNPGYFENMRLDKERNVYIVSREYERQTNEPILYNRFIDIADGFKKHLELLGKGSLSEEAERIKGNSIRAFQAALCNRTITEHILGTSFPGEPCGVSR